MAEFKDLVADSEDYAEAQRQLNSQIEEMKANLASIGISVDSIKTTDLMSYFSDDKYNHSIEPVPFKITDNNGNELNAVSSLPLTADLVDEGLKFRNPKNPSEILTGTYKPYAATTIYTFELKDMNQSEASFSFNYPELIGLSDKTVYPKEIVFIGPDGQFMLYRNSNFSDYAMKYGTDNSKITNFVVKKKRYWWNGDSYMSGWCSKQGESLSYYDHNTKRMTLLFPDEVYCMEMLDTEWQVYTCFDYTAPTGSLEPKAAPTYKWVGSELDVSGMTPAEYYRNLQIVDEKVRAIKTSGDIASISENLFNNNYTRYAIGGIDIYQIFHVNYTWSAPSDVTCALPTGGDYKKDSTIKIDTTYTSDSIFEVENGYYQFSGWNKNDFIITEDTTISGAWAWHDYYSVTYSWTNAPSGVTLPSTVNKLKPGASVTVDTTYNSNTKVINNSGSYKFSGWDKSGNITVTSNVSISGSWIGISWSSLSIGSTFYLGKYQVGSETPWDIEWEIVHQESNYQIAMAKQIIDLRCFDAKESSNSNSSRKNSGNNNWGVSNIEQWLNSDQSNWYSAQHSADAPPSSANVWSNYNPYDTKPGFLYYWTDEEKAVLQDMTLTLANNTKTDGGGSYTWTGKVWLPTYTQMSGKQNNSISEGTQFSKFTDDASRIKTLHAMCATNNQYCIDKSMTEGKALFYWMSSASTVNPYASYYVNSDGRHGSSTHAYYGRFGLAPCIRLPR